MASLARKPNNHGAKLNLLVSPSARVSGTRWMLGLRTQIWIQAVSPSTYILQHMLEHVRLRAEHGSKVVDDDVNSILDFRVAAPSELFLCPSLGVLDECLLVCHGHADGNECVGVQNAESK